MTAQQPESIDDRIKRLAWGYHGTVFIDYDGPCFFARIGIGPGPNIDAQGNTIEEALVALEKRLIADSEAKP